MVGRAIRLEVLDWLRNALKLQTGKTVVDLGAGTGKFTQHLLTTGATVIAVEPVEPMLGQLRQRVPGATALPAMPSTSRSPRDR